MSDLTCVIALEYEVQRSAALKDDRRLTMLKIRVDRGLGGSRGCGRETDLSMFGKEVSLSAQTCSN